jgi:hypothetical protein
MKTTVKKHGKREKTTDKVVEFLEYAKKMSLGKWIKSKDFFYYYDEDTKSIKHISFKYKISASYGRSLLLEFNIFKFKIIDDIEYIQWNEKIVINNTANDLHISVYNYKLEKSEKAKVNAKVKAEKAAEKAKAEAEKAKIELTEEIQEITIENENVNNLGVQEETLEDIIQAIFKTNKIMSDYINKLKNNLNSIL